MILRQLGVLAVAAVLASVLVPSGAGWTDATFTDAEHASSALTALVVPAPVIDTCTASSVLVSVSLVAPRVVLTWHYPTAGYTAGNARYYNSNSGVGGLTPVALGSGVSTTGPVTGTYTTTFEGSLLGGLLGGSGDVGVAAAHASGWLSRTSNAHVTFPLLAGAGTCTIANA